jgi:parvulin-like peptidyl-prolyl isomerase
MPNKEAERIQLQHILISFAGTQTDATRSKADAQKLAGEVLARVKKGEDFGAVMKQLSDDPGPGIYGLFNRGAKQTGRDEYPRDGMVPAFGNVGFALEVGGIGMADFHENDSPFGWHIIKRLK